MPFYDLHFLRKFYDHTFPKENFEKFLKIFKIFFLDRIFRPLDRIFGSLDRIFRPPNRIFGREKKFSKILEIFQNFPKEMYGHKISLGITSHKIPFYDFYDHCFSVIFYDFL